VFKLSGSESGWQLSGSVDSKSRPGISGGREESALNMFKQMDLKGKLKDDTKLETVHQNTISTIRVHEGGPGRLAKFTSTSFLHHLSVTDCHSERCRRKSCNLERVNPGKIHYLNYKCQSLKPKTCQVQME
jgi:hypothetical protein